MATELDVRVTFPLRGGRMVLRTDLDWGRNIEAIRVSADGAMSDFRISLSQPYLYFKPCIVDRGDFYWSQGENYLAITDVSERQEIYPHFFADPPSSGTITDPEEISDPETGSQHRIRVYLPAGYFENTLKRYPVLYMHDGQNLFFPDEAFAGVTWGVEQTLGTLDAMCLIEDIIVVGVYPNDRMNEYTKPGYEAYGRFLVDDLKPMIDARYRTKAGPESTAVMGSSLGGVVSMYLAWQRPDVFSMAACMSSTFGYRDDLLDRVRTEPRRNTRIYIDSGWPRDNYEVSRAMRDALISKGYRQGDDLLYYAFPDAVHNETFWAARFHIPIELFFGQSPAILARATR